MVKMEFKPNGHALPKKSATGRIIHTGDDAGISTSMTVLAKYRLGSAVIIIIKISTAAAEDIDMIIETRLVLAS